MATPPSNRGTEGVTSLLTEDQRKSLDRNRFNEEKNLTTCAIAFFILSIVLLVIVPIVVSVGFVIAPAILFSLAVLGFGALIVSIGCLIGLSVFRKELASSSYATKDYSVDPQSSSTV
jgi:hypothetical protein